MEAESREGLQAMVLIGQLEARLFHQVVETLELFGQVVLSEVGLEPVEEYLAGHLQLVEAESREGWVAVVLTDQLVGRLLHQVVKNLV